MDLREIAESLYGMVELDIKSGMPRHLTVQRGMLPQLDALRSVAPRWVPVGEGLPPTGRDVPLLRPDGSWVIGWYEREFERDCFWRAAWHGPIRVRATHWMPLPPPPEGCKEP